MSTFTRFIVYLDEHCIVNLLTEDDEVPKNMRYVGTFECSASDAEGFAEIMQIIADGTLEVLSDKADKMFEDKKEVALNTKKIKGLN